MPLTFEIDAPDGAGDGSPVIVLLHGRGSDRFDLMGLRRGLPSEAVIVTPEAPFPGAPWGYGPGWAWYRYLGEDRPDPDTFSSSMESLEEFLAGLPGHVGFAPGPVALGGFSQGGTMSLACALRSGGGIPLVLNFSGFLANHPSVRLTPEAVRSIRIFWGHGHRDPAIPFTMAEAGWRSLREAGADLTALDYPIGHWIDPGELAAAADWLRAGWRPSHATEEGGS